VEADNLVKQEALPGVHNKLFRLGLEGARVVFDKSQLTVEINEGR